MATGVLYVRIDEELVEWIREQSGTSGVPMARVTEALLAFARAHGATVTGPIAVAGELARRKPAASAPLTTRAPRLA